MSFVRSALIAAAVIGVVTSGIALAQTTTPSSKVDDVSKWTSKQWNRAKAEWAKEKEKWADCQKQSKDQNLTGRKSWSFLASCMNS
jgi:hypothetical protein